MHHVIYLDVAAYSYLYSILATLLATGESRDNTSR